MARNQNSRFALNPTSLDMRRSRFPRNHSVKTSFNVGQIIPVSCSEVLPGDTVKMETSKVLRLQTLITPIFDNMYVDFYHFFVPMRLCWEHAREFFGENTESAWIPTTEYTIPQLTAPADTGFVEGTIADYFGIPTHVPGLSVNALPFRAYALIMNEWFRNTTVQDPLAIPLDDSNVVGVNTGNMITDPAKGGLPYVANKFSDYFSAALPSPQRGPDVTLPVSSGTRYPVYTMEDTHDPDGVPLALYGRKPTSGTNSGVTGERALRWNYTGSALTIDSDGFDPSTMDTETGQSGYGYQEPVNLWAVDADPVSATINELRFAFQLQKYYEKLARGGDRYREIIKEMFGVTSPDARMQIPEYLGGSRFPVNINQVIQQSGTGSGSETPQGTVTGMSVTTDRHYDFVKSFTEHGYLMTLAVVRYSHSYQQGLNKMWTRKGKFDFYWPVFANIGEQAVKNVELYAQGPSVLGEDGQTPVDNEVFGYQEAWAEYRYTPNLITGQMRSNYAQSLDVWHLADDYSSLPHLSPEWIVEDKNTVDRVLAVSSGVANQIFGDIYFKEDWTRVMPLYSVPGLIDHH